MAEATTYNAAGNREDLTDVLMLVSPEKTPKLSLSATGAKPRAMLHEWQIDKLDAPAFAGVVEGADTLTYTNPAANRTRLSNRVQRFERPFKVTLEQQEVSTVAGVPDEYSRAKAQAITYIKTCVEAAIGSDNEATASASGTAYLMRGLGKWTDSSNANIPEAARMPAAQSVVGNTLTEEGLNGLIQSAYEQCGNDGNYTLFAGTGLVGKISKFLQRGDGSTNVYNVNQDAESRKVSLSVQLFESDFGTIKIVKDLFNGRTSGTAYGDEAKWRGYLIPDGAIAIGWHTQPFAQDLANTTADKRGTVNALLTLMVKNPLTLGKLYYQAG